MSNTTPSHNTHSVSIGLGLTNQSIRAPRILFLYGSLRQISYSRLLAQEGMRIIASFGAEVELFHPHSLPLADISLTQNPDQNLFSSRQRDAQANELV